MWGCCSGTRPEDLNHRGTENPEQTIFVGWRNSPMSRNSNADAIRCQLVVEPLESRVAPALIASQFALNPPVIDATDVSSLLQRAAAATASDDWIIAILDRRGTILGVLQPNCGSPHITGNPAQ